ncbi:MAG: exonuclease SbcCD subunit D [Pirellulaceae bacterium]
MKHRFMHVADVHLDRPLDNLKRLDPRLAEELASASRRSFARTVDLAISEQVAAFVVAGDLFDGPVRDAAAALWVCRQFQQLVRNGIEVVLIRGNHDANSGSGGAIQWPEGVYELSTSEPETRLVESAGIAIHGQSFGARAESSDLASKYPQPKNGWFNLGVLHTSLSGGAGHDTYAPTSISTLEAMDYDYWALGHIHIRSQSSLSDRCFVGFSGNTQGCHIRESGPKGCQIVTVEDGRLADIKFAPTDSVRWHECELDLSDTEQLQECPILLEAVEPELEQAADGRPLALRIKLTGDSPLHRELTTPASYSHLSEEFADTLTQMGNYWLEKLKVDTSPACTLQLANFDLPVKYLQQATSEAQSEGVFREELEQSLEELFKKARTEIRAGDRSHEPNEESFEQQLHEAESLLIAKLTGEAS